MMFVISRSSFTNRGTPGILSLVTPEGAVPICLTLEEQWLDNQSNISCIPPGGYLCKRVYSPKFGDTFEITNVIGRTHVLFHSGNTIADTQGCVLLGAEFGINVSLMKSRVAFELFKSYLIGKDEFSLLIKNPAPSQFKF